MLQMGRLAIATFVTFLHHNKPKQHRNITMYDNPAHIKDNRINARFDDIELDEIIEIANLDGLQKSSLVRLATLEYIQKRKEEYAEKLKAMKEAS